MLLAIDLAPVADVHDKYYKPFAVDLIEDSVVTDANPPSLPATKEL